MGVKLTVGPPALTINRSNTFMVTNHDGEINQDRAEGVFADDTRFVSAYHLWVNGKNWLRITSATPDYHTAQLYLTNPELENTFSMSSVHRGRLLTPKVPGGTLGLRLARSIDEGVRESFEITNYGLDKISIALEIEIVSDFADLFEVKANQLRQRENIITQWNPGANELVTTYENKDFLRRFKYIVVEIDRPPSYSNGRLLLPVHLEPGASWYACAHMLFQHGEHVRQPRPERVLPDVTTDTAETLHQKWLSTCTVLKSSDYDFNQSYWQAVDDMGALRLLERDLGPDIWVPAAGVPWYVTLFGRDTLITSLQNMIVHASFAEGALRTLAKYQAHERDDWRDAQPGKILHEIRYGELAHFHLIPHTPYYGTWDATPLFLIVLHQAWLWLGDRKLIDDLRPTAESCLEWIDKYGDFDGDGFQEYRSFSPDGYENMGWKDSGVAVVYPDGSQVKQPKALCELQGYVYAAKRGMAEVFAALGDHDRARILESEAAELKHRFNKAFWMENEGTYAFGLDPDKRQIKTIASNPGHCLWTGIADDDKAKLVVERLLEPDMWSGWGIRTLSTRNPAYNPFSYQNGSVWPHDNSIIAAGMKRYGFYEQANQIARSTLDAAGCFQNYRLPEVFAGIARDHSQFPAQYRGANIPQAWAAGSIFHFVQTILGLRADAPNAKLWVNPTLPDWAPSLDLSGLKVGPVRLNLHFWREGKESHFAVESEHGGHIDVLQERAETGPALTGRRQRG